MEGREAALWEVEERHLLELGAEKKQHVQQSYDLRRRQLTFRRAQVRHVSQQLINLLHDAFVRTNHRHDVCPSVGRAL